MRQLVYFSTASDRQDAIVVAAILAHSRHNNLQHGITGVLIAGGHRYLQVIEGPRAAIGRLAIHLRRDERHLAMTILIDRKVDSRSFDRWSMAFAEEPRLGEFATFKELVEQMRLQLADENLRNQLDCLASTFSSANPPIDVPLWQTAERDSSSVDGGHQAGIAARRRGVDAGHPFSGEAGDIVRPPRLWPGAA